MALAPNGSCMLMFTLACYGWVALALPVYANVSWDSERPLNKPAHTGRASATQLSRDITLALINSLNLSQRHRIIELHSVGVYAGPVPCSYCGTGNVLVLGATGSASACRTSVRTQWGFGIGFQSTLYSVATVAAMDQLRTETRQEDDQSPFGERVLGVILKATAAQWVAVWDCRGREICQVGQRHANGCLFPSEAILDSSHLALLEKVRVAGQLQVAQAQVVHLTEAGQSQPRSVDFLSPPFAAFEAWPSTYWKSLSRRNRSKIANRRQQKSWGFANSSRGTARPEDNGSHAPTRFEEKAGAIEQFAAASHRDLDTEGCAIESRTKRLCCLTAIGRRSSDGKGVRTAPPL